MEDYKKIGNLITVLAIAGSYGAVGAGCCGGEVGAC